MHTLAVIGAGNMGMAVASLAVGAGFDVVLSNTRGPESLARHTAYLGPHSRAATIADAARAADLVLLPIPFSAHKRIDPDPFQGRIIMDTSNYYQGYSEPEPDLDTHRSTSSRLLQDHFVGSRIVKVFNTIYTEHLKKLARLPGASDRSGLPFAGDDEDSSELVAQFIDRIGFDPIAAGSIDESWRFEPGTPAFVTPYQVRPDVHFTQDPGAVAVAATIVKALADGQGVGGSAVGR